MLDDDLFDQQLARGEDPVEGIPVIDLRRVIAVHPGACLATGSFVTIVPWLSVNARTSSALPSSTTIQSRWRCSLKTRLNSILSWNSAR